MDSRSLQFDLVNVNLVRFQIDRPDDLYVLARKSFGLLLVVDGVHRPLPSLSKNKFPVRVRDSSGKCSHVQV